MALRCVDVDAQVIELSKLLPRIRQQQAEPDEIEIYHI